MRNRKGFTLIELMIVIAIIAIIAAIAIPGILSARKSANSNAAFGNLKSFLSAMVVYQGDNAEQKYPATEADFGKYFSHVAIKSGYNFAYKATANADRFVYIAYPVNQNNGNKSYYCDESNQIWEGYMGADANATLPDENLYLEGAVPATDADFDVAVEANNTTTSAGNRATWTKKGTGLGTFYIWKQKA